MLKNKKIINAIFLIAGSAGLMFSGLNWHIGITAWIAPIFLLLFTRNTKRINFLFFFAAMFFAGAFTQTDGNIMNLMIVNIINGLSFSIVFTLLFITDKFLYKKNGPFYYTLVFPVLVTITEFVSSFAVGTWGSIANAHYEYMPLMQLASVIGIYGIWFSAAWFASVVYWIIENKSNTRLVFKGMLISGSVIFIVLLLGEIRTESDVAVKNNIKISGVLSDTDIHQFAEDESELMRKAVEDPTTEVPDRIFSDSLTIETMLKRTRSAAMQGAEIIIWNEISLILSQSQKEELIFAVQSICKDYDVYVLTAILEECEEANKKPFNNISVFISPEGEILWDYKKSFLEPVGEAMIVNEGNFEMPVVETPHGIIGGVICADLDIQDYIKQAGHKSADILLVPAYDWEGITPIHSQMAGVQAIQFGISIVRINGKGVSAFYNCKGKEIASFNTFNSDEKIFTAVLPLSSVPTIYSAIGNTFIYICLAFLIFILVKRFQKAKKPAGN